MTKRADPDARKSATTVKLNFFAILQEEEDREFDEIERERQRKADIASVERDRQRFKQIANWADFDSDEDDAVEGLTAKSVVKPDSHAEDQTRQSDEKIEDAPIYLTLTKAEQPNKQAARKKEPPHRKQKRKTAAAPKDCTRAAPSAVADCSTLSRLAQTGDISGCSNSKSTNLVSDEAGRNPETADNPEAGDNSFTADGRAKLRAAIAEAEDHRRRKTTDKENAETEDPEVKKRLRKERKAENRRKFEMR